MLKQSGRPTGAIAIVLLGTSVATAADKDFSLFGTARVVEGEKKNQYVVYIESESVATFGGISYDPKKPVLFEDLRSLSATYRLLEGGMGGGSPRFSIGIDEDGDGEADCNIFVYLGTPPDFDDEPTGDIEFTGNFIGGSDLRWDTSQCGGTFYDDYQGALELVGEYDVVYVDFVVDGGWSQEEGIQSIEVYELRVDRSKYKPKKPKSRGRDA